MMKIYLCLENEMVFEGECFGAYEETIGELVFETSAVGYPETITDNNYKGQIVVKTFPLMGNYGMVFDSENKKPSLSALIVREACETPSNFRCEGTLSDFLKTNGIPAICGIDTRELTRIIRDNGSQKAAICKEIPKSFDFIKNYNAPIYQNDICVKEKNTYGSGNKKVALLDCGTSEASIDALVNLGCEVCVFPYTATAKEIMQYNPNGIFISDGPGNPEDMSNTINCASELLGKYPIFAVGLGHEILALANGCGIIKLKHGHRGSNQPALHKETGKTHITNQNHGYCVDTEKLSQNANITFINENDGSIEGLNYKDISAFSVQFRPEGYTGPNNTLFLYKKFLENMEDKVCL